MPHLPDQTRPEVDGMQYPGLRLHRTQQAGRIYFSQTRGAQTNKNRDSFILPIAFSQRFKLSFDTETQMYTHAATIV